MALTQVKAGGLTADLIDETKLADDSIDSEHYNNGSIDHEHLANDAIDGDNLADNAVDSEHYTDGSIDTAHIADDQITLAKMAGGTDGVIITYDASGDPVHVGPGTDGQVLTSTGAGSPPAFEAIPSSGTATNLIINGAMRIAQRGTSSTDTGLKTLDRFAYYKAGTQTQSQADIASATSGPYASGFRKCYKVTNGSNTAGNTDAATFQYTIEDQDLVCSGWNHTDPNSKLTLSFWARSSVAQTFYFQIRTKHGTNQGYWSSYALSADTWTKVTKTIPGYANISLANDTGQGFNLSWNTYYGTDNTGSGGLAENTWGAFAGGTSTPDQTVTWQNTNTATFELTGVQLETGDTATDFAHKSYDEELLRCQRYFQVWTGENCGNFAGRWNGTSDFVYAIPVAIPLRNTPSVECKANDTSGSGNGEWKVFREDGASTCTNVPTVRSWTANTPQILMNLDGLSSGTDDRVGSIQATLSASGFLRLSAEL